MASTLQRSLACFERSIECSETTNNKSELVIGLFNHLNISAAAFTAAGSQSFQAAQTSLQLQQVQVRMLASAIMECFMQQSSSELVTGLHSCSTRTTRGCSITQYNRRLFQCSCNAVQEETDCTARGVMALAGRDFVVSR